MKLDILIKTMHKFIGVDSLYSFTIDIFNDAARIDLGLELDVVRNWFRTKNPTLSYRKLFNEKTFDTYKFRTELKRKTYGTWKALRDEFAQSKQCDVENLIAYNTDNHDEFIESIIYQFKSILRIPIIVDKPQNNIAISGNFAHSTPEYNPKLTFDKSRNLNGLMINIDINELIAFETNKTVHVNDKWVVTADLSLELLLFSLYPEMLWDNLSKGMHYTYYIYAQENKDNEGQLINEFLKYGYNVPIIYLSRTPKDINYFVIPRWGYFFYFASENKECSTMRGYEIHRFYESSINKTYRMYDGDVHTKISILKLIKERASIIT
ncbi:MAG: hypothetical protein FWB80_02825 [Defluviitaleaceae bacterium]|nr:hypothetical protein [Defluviitaleaceae bacterium]